MVRFYPDAGLYGALFRSSILAWACVYHISIPYTASILLTSFLGVLLAWERDFAFFEAVHRAEQAYQEVRREIEKRPPGFGMAKGFWVLGSILNSKLACKLPLLLAPVLRNFWICAG